MQQVIEPQSNESGVDRKNEIKEFLIWKQTQKTVNDNISLSNQFQMQKCYSFCNSILKCDQHAHVVIIIAGWKAAIPDLINSFKSIFTPEDHVPT